MTRTYLYNQMKCSLSDLEKAYAAGNFDDVLDYAALFCDALRAYTGSRPTDAMFNRYCDIMFVKLR